MSRPKFIDEIRKLDIPSTCKAEFALLYAMAIILPYPPPVSKVVYMGNTQ